MDIYDKNLFFDFNETFPLLESKIVTLLSLLNRLILLDENNVEFEIGNLSHEPKITNKTVKCECGHTHICREAHEIELTEDQKRIIETFKCNGLEITSIYPQYHRGGSRSVCVKVKAIAGKCPIIDKLHFLWNKRKENKQLDNNHIIFYHLMDNFYLSHLTTEARTNKYLFAEYDSNGTDYIFDKDIPADVIDMIKESIYRNLLPYHKLYRGTSNGYLWTNYVVINADSKPLQSILQWIDIGSELF
jgi:uncharacterized protein YlaI